MGEKTNAVKNGAVLILDPAKEAQQLEHQHQHHHHHHQQHQQHKHLAAWRKLLFGLAAPPLQMTGNVCGFFFGLFLLEVVRMPPALVSAIIFTGRVWDAVTDPLVGQLLFRTNTRFGRTRPWLLVAAPLGSCAFFCMWTFVDLPPVPQFLYYLLVYLLYCTLITCYHVPYTASTILISPHAKDKDGATAARTAFELLFTVVGCGLFGYVIKDSRMATNCNATLAAGNGSELAADEMIMRAKERSAYMMAGGLISLIFLLCGIVAVVGIRERVRPVGSQRESLLANVRSVLAFKPYLLLMFAFLFVSLGIQTVQANLALFATHSIDMPSHTMSGIVNVLIVAVVFVPLWYLVADRFGKKLVFFVGMTPLLPCLVFGTVMPSHSAVALYSLTSISGVSISVAMLMPWAMLPDVIDAYYLQYGQRKEATFYSLYVFFSKFAAGISLAVSQLVLVAGSYDSGDGGCHQPASVGVALRLLVGPGPIVCILVALLLIFLYPIDRRRRLEMNRQLSERRFSAPKLMIEPPTCIDLERRHSAVAAGDADPEAQAETDENSSSSSDNSLPDVNSTANLLHRQR